MNLKHCIAACAASFFFALLLASGWYTIKIHAVKRYYNSIIQSTQINEKDNCDFRIHKHQKGSL